MTTLLERDERAIDPAAPGTPDSALGDVVRSRPAVGVDERREHSAGIALAAACGTGGEPASDSGKH